MTQYRPSPGEVGRCTSHHGVALVANARPEDRQRYALLRAGFSDFGFTVEDLFSTGDRVAVRLTVRGTHDGEFMGRPPTGQQFAVASVGIFRSADGRIIEHWGVFDQLAMLGQLGALGG
jgi:predicted ester cyclase